jgi:DNA polymerase-3 subunit alpha
LGYPGSLHGHTDYSNLRLRDAISTIESSIDRAIELGHEVIAFTEHETISNAVKIEKYYSKVKKDHPDFKVIRGNEIYLCRDGLSPETYIAGQDKYWHFILLAKNARGHEQIRELSTRAWERSYSSRGMTRVPTYYQDLIEIIGQDRGNVIGSSACLGGWLPQHILEYLITDDETVYEQIINWCTSMVHLFGEGNFYFEMQPSRNDEQIEVNKFLLNLSSTLNIPYIITTDTHYTRREDAPIHKAFLNSQDGEREVDSFYATTYIMDTTEIELYFDYFTEIQLNTAYENIRKIKDACEDYSLLKPLKIPSLIWKIPETKTIEEEWYEKIPYLRTFAQSSFDGDNILARAVVDKLKKDSRLQNQETYDELNSNLEITWKSSEVNKTHWSAYFLNLQKTIEECWNAGTLVGPGRGSGVGFALLYVLDIIQINPLWEETKCYSWRFLNPERVSVLDIDSDIEGGRRAQVLQHLRDFYGQDRVANVVTFGTEKSKSAIQTAARGLGIDSDVGLYLASLIPADRGQTRTLKECFYGDEEKGFKPIPTFVNAMTNDYPEVWEVAQKIEGLVCRVGEHAGGVIFVDEPFTKSTALMKVPNGDIVTQFDLHDSEDCSQQLVRLLNT